MLCRFLRVTVSVAIFAPLVLGLFLTGPGLILHKAHARDLEGRYANSPLKGWFEQLRSEKGLCCTDADGSALSEVDWESNDGHYRSASKTNGGMSLMMP